MNAVATDDQLMASARKSRSETLANMYLEAASMTPCTCAAEAHTKFVRDCPKAVWEHAAHMAKEMENA